MAEPHFHLRRMEPEHLEASVEDAAELLIRRRVESKLGKVDGRKLARVV